MVHFSGKARKMNHIPPFARAKRARKTRQFRFYVWFQNFLLILNRKWFSDFRILNILGRFLQSS
ncbi:MAG: hypothetical protein U5L45_12210 [Saprospiraceae bacterium]|nr:hypothetical protein [Saprospiraceae bacterium]